MMNTFQRRLLFLCLALAGLVGVWIARSTANAYVLMLINFAGIYAILAVSLNITNGFAGLFSLGHPAFMAIGGYVTVLLTFPDAKKPLFLPDMPSWLANVELPFLPSLIAGGFMAALVSLVVGVPVLRLRGHYLAVATIGFLIITKVLIINMDAITRGPLGLHGLYPFTNLWWVYGFVLLTLYTAWKIKFSSFGRIMMAIREDELSAQCLGINLFRTKLIAFLTGAFFAGIAGGLWAHLITAINPGAFSLIMAFNIVVMVVIGGSGSITGVFLAAILVTNLTEFMRPIEENLDMYGIGEVIISFILILILISRPRGIFGTSEPSFFVGKSSQAKGVCRGKLKLKLERRKL